MDAGFLAYLAFTAILVATPGSATAVVVRNTIAGGRPAGLAATAGAGVANAFHAVAVGLGLAGLLSRWPQALEAVRFAGALYLAWLGVRSLVRSWALSDGGIAFMGDQVGGPLDHRSSFREGLTVNLLNPAIITFYLVIVPTFVPLGAPAWYFAALAVTHIVLALVCHSTWSVAFGSVRRWFGRPLTRRLLEAAAGLALLGLAVQVVT